jgi:hypothetical protein
MDAEGLADYRYETMDDEAAAECRYRFEKED